MYIVTGGAGFIGSAFVAKLNAEGHDDILIVDELGSTDKWYNLRNKRYRDYVHKDAFIRSVTSDALPKQIKGIIHMGACSSTTERDIDYLMENNFQYTKTLAEYAIQKKIRFIYASSAATYGGGEHGYSDDPSLLSTLHPLNGYGYSKQLFDCYASSHSLLSKIVGLKFFNVFGPNEHHKGDMRSMVAKAYEQIAREGKIKLFKSFDAHYKDGEQKRDFVYVKDCTESMYWLLTHPEVTGIYNLGSGVARTWNDLVHAVFAALKRSPQIEYIDMPESLRGQYQNFTQADMQRLSGTGCPVPKTSLEDAVHDYVVNYLVPGVVW